MTTGPDNLGNGAAKTEDRFSGQLGYRPRGNRDGGSLSAAPRSPMGEPLNGSGLAGSGNPLVGPLDGMSDDFGTDPDDFGARSDDFAQRADDFTPRPDDFGTRKVDFGARKRNGPRNDDFGSHASGSTRKAMHIENPIASTLTEPTLPVPDPIGTGADAWLGGAANTVTDHPLLRGLLMELPPKGATLQVQWLDRWFEAARSILELLYRFEDKRD